MNRSTLVEQHRTQKTAVETLCSIFEGNIVKMNMDE